MTLKTAHTVRAPPQTPLHGGAYDASAVHISQLAVEENTLPILYPIDAFGAPIQ